MFTHEDVRQFKKECLIHELLFDHPLIVKAIDWYLNEDETYPLFLDDTQEEPIFKYAYLKFPYYKNGTLHDFLERIRRNKK